MPSASERTLLLILAGLMAFGPLSIDMYLPGFPLIAADFAVPTARVELSLASFFIGLALGQLLHGPLSDRYGRRPIVLLGLGVYVAASIACALAPSAEFLVAARFVQALGACAGIVVSRAVVRDRFEPQQAARVFSMLMLVMGVAPIVAPLLGAVVSDVAGWRAMFGLLAIVGLTCAWAVFRALPETRRPAAQKPKWLAVLADRSFVRHAVSGGVAYAGMFAYITGSPFVFIELFGLSPRQYGYVFAANAAALIASSQLNRRLLVHREMKWILRRAFPVLALAGVVLAAGAWLQWGVWGVALPLWCYVGILGMTYPNTTATAMQAHAANAGAASAWLGTLQFSVAASASALVSWLHDESALAMAGVVGGCGVLSCVVYLAFHSATVNVPLLACSLRPFTPVAPLRGAIRKEQQ
jgi:MFS transporter, DHA1 family, multidrug resistance protein